MFSVRHIDHPTLRLTRPAYGVFASDGKMVIWYERQVLAEDHKDRLNSLEAVGGPGCVWVRYTDK